MKFFILVLLVGFVSAHPMVVMESIKISKEWKKVGVPLEHHPIEIRIAIKQGNFEKLEEELYEVSDPKSPRYGHHLSKEKVEQLVTPHPVSIKRVIHWLEGHGVSGYFSKAKDWFKTTLPISKVEQMLNTKYHVYQHQKTGETLVRTTEYSLPEYLYDHVDLVAPTTYVGNLMPQSVPSAIKFGTPLSSNFVNNLKNELIVPNVENCNTLMITPACLQALYQTNGYQTRAHNINELGIAGFLEQFSNIADLQQFFRNFQPRDIGRSFKFVSINGGINIQDIALAGVEASVDVQYGMAMSNQTPTTYYLTGGRPPIQPPVSLSDNTNEPYLDFLEFILNQKKIPQTISISYEDSENTVPFNYALRVCQLFAQLGARGVSVLFSSGDGGVGGDCLNKTSFSPNFPSSCPYVTSVGSTCKIDPEVAGFDLSNGFRSGGGFSNYFSRPQYQMNAVETYLNIIGNYNWGQYNPNGRAYPDVSAQGVNITIVFQASFASLDGTTFSVNIFSGIISLVNDFLISMGKQPLGFLNPFIYSFGYQGLTDIIMGSNPACGGSNPFNKGFYATRGWDPVTGFGTPVFPKLQELALQAQSMKPVTVSGKQVPSYPQPPLTRQNKRNIKPRPHIS